MDIKHGDIITLHNGDIAKVSLEILKKVTQLIINSKYELQYSGQLCHIVTSRKEVDSNSKELERSTWIYIGMITLAVGNRYIFLSDRHNATYAMFSTATLNFVLTEVN